MYSLRVRWVPLFRSFRRRGAFAMGLARCVDGFPVRRLLCPIRRSSLALSFREVLPPHYFPLRCASREESPVFTMEDANKMV